MRQESKPNISRTSQNCWISLTCTVTDCLKKLGCKQIVYISGSCGSNPGSFLTSCNCTSHWGCIDFAHMFSESVTNNVLSYSWSGRFNVRVLLSLFCLRLHLNKVRQRLFWLFKFCICTLVWQLVDSYCNLTELIEDCDICFQLKLIAAYIFFFVKVYSAKLLSTSTQGNVDLC